MNLALLGILASSFAPGEAPPRPNVLFIISDDLNCDLNCYGATWVKSPNLDRLAASGVRFNHAYVQYPVCNPSRTSFLTGLRPEKTRILGNNIHFRKNLPEVKTLPQWFRGHGYYTASLGKVFHRGLSPEELRPDMDDPPSWDHRFYGQATEAGKTGERRNMSGGKLPWCNWLAADCDDEGLQDGQTTKEAIRLMEAGKDKPWFIAIGFYRPHDPFHSPKKYFDLYPVEKMKLPPGFPAGGLPNAFTLPGGAFKSPFDSFTEDDKREFLRAYYAGLTYMDAQVGKLLDSLHRLRLEQNTVVVFLGDHGYELGVRNWWNKNTLFEKSCRVPFLVRWPGAKGNGKTTQGIVEAIDIYPTLCELAKVGAPSGLQGESFARLLDDPAKLGKETAFTTVERGGARGLSLRTVRYRYTEWKGKETAAELYDHNSDAGEVKNLAGDPALKEIQLKLALRLEQFRQQNEVKP